MERLTPKQTVNVSAGTKKEGKCFSIYDISDMGDIKYTIDPIQIQTYPPISILHGSDGNTYYLHEKIEDSICYHMD